MSSSDSFEHPDDLTLAGVADGERVDDHDTVVAHIGGCRTCQSVTCELVILLAGGPGDLDMQAWQFWWSWLGSTTANNRWCPVLGHRGQRRRTNIPVWSAVTCQKTRPQRWRWAVPTTQSPTGPNKVT